MKEYMEKNRSRIFLIGLFVFLIHGAKLNSNILGIDTEDLIQYEHEFYGGWLETGRQGLVFLKRFMGNLSYNPYFSGLLTLVCFAAAVCAMLLLWDSVGRKRKISFVAWGVCSFLWISHPIITEQFYFTLQSAEVCIAMILTALALYLTRHWKSSIAAILLLLVTFSVYQVMVVFYIFGAVTLVLLQGLSDVKQEECSVRKLWLRIVPYVVVFLMAFAGNTVITKCFFQGSDYLENQIQWGQGVISENIRLIMGHIVKSMTGYDSIYYNMGYGILCAVTLVTMVVLLIGLKKRKSLIISMVFFLAALFSTPYLMTIIIGGTPAVRSQLILPAATGFLAYFVVEMWLELRNLYGVKSTAGRKGVLTFLYGVILVGCIIGVWEQTKTTMRLYYTDRMRFEQDAAIARELMNRIEDMYEDEVALVVVGNKPFRGNNICVDGEMIGVSFFEHDTEMEPQYYWSTRRILGLLHYFGADYEIAPLDRFDSAITHAKRRMDAWPDYDCVDELEGIVVVKMSEIE